MSGQKLKLSKRLEKMNLTDKFDPTVNELVTKLRDMKIINRTESDNVLKQPSTLRIKDIFDIVERKEKVEDLIEILRKMGQDYIAEHIERAATRFIRKLSANQNVLEGAKLELVCEVNNKEFAAEWIKDGVRIVDENITFDNNNGKHSCTIQSVRIRDTGKYCCKIGESKTTCHVYVNENVEIQNDMKDLTIQSRRKAILEVTLKKPSQKIADWFKDDRQLKDDDKYVITTPSLEIRRLEIYQVNQADGGTYQCKIGNATSKMVTVIIKETNLEELSILDYGNMIGEIFKTRTLIGKTDFKIQELEELKTTLLAKRAELENELNVLKEKDNDSLLSEISKLNDEVSTMKKDIEQLENDKTELEEKVKFLENKLTSEKDKRLEELNNQTTEHNNQLERQKEQHKEQLSTEAMQHNKLLSELKNMYDKQLSEQNEEHRIQWEKQMEKQKELIKTFEQSVEMHKQIVECQGKEGGCVIC